MLLIQSYGLTLANLQMLQANLSKGYPSLFSRRPNSRTFPSRFLPNHDVWVTSSVSCDVFCSKKEKRAVVGGMFVSIALTAFLTGVTEPIEFTFMFLSPVLYGIHAVLTGISLAISYIIGFRDGFGFSAGLIDYLLNFGLADRPWLLIPLGLGFGAIYFVIFIS